MRFSIIVPVYNTVRYLTECVQSILSQSFTDFELILADDGSTDGSGALCDDFAARDGRILVLHRPNGGPAAARNAGIRKARGEYLLLIDSDDFYADADVLSRLAAYAADVVCINCARLRKSRRLPGKPLLGPLCPREAAAKAEFLPLAKANIYTSSACLKRVSRRLVLDNGLFFEEGRLGEDIEWNARLALCAKSFSFEYAALYVYRVRPGSRTHSFSQKNIDDMFIILDRLEQAAPAEQSSNLYRGYMGYTAFQFCTLLINIRFAPIKNLRQNLRLCKARRHLLKHAACGQAKLVRRAAYFLGLRLCSFLLFHLFRAKSL